MAQRFVRCSLCGMPHDAEARECPVHKRPIVPAARVDRTSAPEPTPRRVVDVPPRLSPPPPPPAVMSTPPRGTLVAGALLAGRYRVQGVIAQGGMGVVYEADDTREGRAVAVKVLHPRYAADRSAHARFAQEAAVAGSFGHPNIVAVYDVGALDGGVPFMVMERLRGETVSRRLQRERPLGVALGVEIARQTLHALIASHARGVLHRDLKPDNLFLVEGPELRVKVLDFGVAKALYGGPSAPKITRAGHVMGTPTYMSPEHARGDVDLDARADLYALGMILYETLAGRLPFSATSPTTVLVEIQRATLRPLRALRPEVPEALSALVMQCLSKDRDRRPWDALTMMRDLLAVPLPAAPGEVSIAARGAEVISPTTTEEHVVEVFSRKG